MYYLCDLICPDPKSAHLVHYVYDTSDKTCCFCTMKDYKVVSDMISDRDKEYEIILNESKAKYFKYKTVYNSEVKPYCVWSFGNFVVQIDIDYSCNFPRLMLYMYYSGLDSCKIITINSSRFYLRSGNLCYAAIPYEFFVMLINRKYSCFVTFFKDLKFLCDGNEFILTLNWDNISFVQ